MTPLILNPRGTTGSGKTYIVRQVIKRIGVDHPIVENNKIVGYILKDGTYVMGSYEMTCGGADTIKTQEEICTLVRRYSEDPKVTNIIFEGVLASHIYGRYLELSRNLKRGVYVWLFLDTPLDVCIERVCLRREAVGQIEPFDPKPHTIPKYKSILNATKKAINDMQLVVILDYKKSVEQTLRILRYRKFPQGRVENLALYEEAIYER